MDMVIRVDGHYIRLSPFNREKMKEQGATGPTVRLKYAGMFYTRDSDGTEMMDVTSTWRKNG
jgi:hypothetical protein